jgi:GT2 family glycosyltransferase
MKYWAHDEIRKVDVLSGCFWMVRRKALDEVGLLDEDFFIYGEDIDWCRRCHGAGWDVVFCPSAEAIHARGTSSSKAPIRFYVEMQKADLQYWKKYHGKAGRLAYWMMLLVRQLVRLPVFACMYAFCPKRREMAHFKVERAIACVRFLLGFNVDK